MLEFLRLNAGTILVGVIVLVILVAALVKIRRDKKNGAGCGCGCGCAGCPSQGVCHGNGDAIGSK